MSESKLLKRIEIRLKGCGYEGFLPRFVDVQAGIYTEDIDWRVLKAIRLAINEAKEDLFDHWRRNLIHTGLVKWLGVEDPKSSHVYSELELKKMAYGMPINTKEPTKTE